MNTQVVPQLLPFAKRKNAQATEAHIYVKITYAREAHEKSLGMKCAYADWNSQQMTIANQPVLSYQLQQKIEELRQKLMGAFYILKQEDASFSLQELLEVYAGNRKPGALSFFQSFRDVIERMEKVKGGDGNSVTNIQKHKRALDHFTNFCKLYYKATDLAYQKITRSTLDDFLDFLKVEGGCSHNTAMKYMQIIKKVYRIGMDNGWVKSNAFANFKFKMKTVDRNFLTEKELDIIRKKTFKVERLEQVRDLFLFSCFTGLAYIDVKSLQRKNIVENDGSLWIKSKRTKTGIEASIPLLPPAKKILEKFNPSWQECNKEVELFHIISNQKMNAYLKEVADLCGIDKTITFHLARHTFATTVTLSNNIPLETVSKMLGHSRITMTQHYSKVVDLKIARDTKKLHAKFLN